MLVFSAHPFMVAGSLLLIGFGCGGEVSLAGIVFIEFCPPSKRYLMTFMALFWGIGATSTAAIALAVSLTNNTDIYDWRYICGCGACIEICCFITRFFLIETPAYCASKGDNVRAEQILNIISLQNTGKEFILADLELSNQLSVELYKPDAKPRLGKLLKKLFGLSMLKTTLLLGIVNII